MNPQNKPHPEFEFEVGRLQETVGHIRANLENGRRRDFDGGDDWATANLQQQHSIRLERLREVLDRPYIGRIDFQEDDHDEVEEFYIGYANLDGPVRVIDWRAAFASLFYTKNRVHVSYNAPGGTVYGELFLKRHLDIERCKLLTIRDELDRRLSHALVSAGDGIQPDTLIDPDEYLRLVLEGKKGRELRDVVATIQERQNDLICAEPNQILVVQGAAGSGKTTVALHRVAFLLYPQTDEVLFEPQRMLIIGASEVFLQFISQVLPQLGIKDVPQLTFTDWVGRLMGRQAPRQVSDATLTDLLNLDIPRQQRVNLYNLSRLKGSLRMLPVLDRLIDVYRRRVSAPESDLEYTPTGIGSLDLTYHVPPQAVAEVLTETQHLLLNQRRNQVVTAVINHVIAQHERDYPARVEELISTLESGLGDRTQRQKWAGLIEPYDYRRIPTQSEIAARNISAADVSAMIQAAERRRRRALDNLRGEITHLVNRDFEQQGNRIKSETASRSGMNGQGRLCSVFDADCPSRGPASGY